MWNKYLNPVAMVGEGRFVCLLSDVLGWFERYFKAQPNALSYAAWVRHTDSRGFTEPFMRWIMLLRKQNFSVAAINFPGDVEITIRWAELEEDFSVAFDVEVTERERSRSPRR